MLRERADNMELDYQLSLGLDSFQADLLAILAEFIGKKDTNLDDREIVSKGLSIWMSCIASEPKLLNHIYQDFESHDDK